MSFRSSLTAAWPTLVSRGAAAAVLIAGIAVLAGHLREYPALTTLLTSGPPLRPFAGAAFMLCGVCLWLASAARPPHRLVRLLSGSLVVASLLATSSLLSGWPLSQAGGLAQGLARAARHAEPTNLALALVFLCAGAALLLQNGTRPRGNAWMSIPLLPVFWAAYFSLAASFYKVESLNVYFARTLIPLPAAIVFAILIIGLLSVRPNQGLMAAVTSRYSGGLLARVTLPLLLVLPFTIGWIRIQALRTGHYDLAASFAQFSASNVVVFGAMLWVCAHVLNRSDARRQKALESLRAVNRELQTVNGALEAKITEQVQTEEAWKKTELQLFQSQKMEAIGTLASGIAHDFNNILTIIQLNTETAQDAASQGASRDDLMLQNSLREIRKSSARAADVVRQIMTFGRKTAGEKKELHPEEIVAETLEMLRHTLPSTVRIHTDFAPGLPRILANAVQVQQVLLNIGTNAAHAMAEEGGTLEVRMEAVIVTRKQTDPDEGPAEGRHVLVTFRDDGHGMDEETRKRIFDPFFTTKPPGKGTGLGLSVAHGIIRLHGGCITVSSRPGQGTLFSLYFPAADGA